MFNAQLFKLIQHFPWLSNFVHAHDGYMHEDPKESDYWFGQQKVNKQILQADGQWTKVLPADEFQSGSRVETMGCTGYSLNNCMEMIFKTKWNNIINNSDRYTNKVTGTTTNGNSMTRVADNIRKNYGWVKEETWPWDRSDFTWSKYYSNIPVEIIKTGGLKLKEYVLSYELVPMNVSLMKEALKYSPLWVAGYAWYNQGGLYRSYGRANHAFTVVGYVDGSHWLAYDSYSPFLKKLAWDFQFGAVFQVIVDKKEKEFDQSKLNRLLERGFEYLMRVDKVNGGAGQVYRITNNGLVELSDQEKMEIGIRALHEKAGLTGISEADYLNLYV